MHFLFMGSIMDILVSVIFNASFLVHISQKVNQNIFFNCCWWLAPFFRWCIRIQLSDPGFTVCEHGQQYSSCACSKTCANLYSVLCSEGEDCQGGCACPEGMVLDEWNGQCVAAAACPCLYGNETHAVYSLRPTTDKIW